MLHTIIYIYIYIHTHVHNIHIHVCNTYTYIYIYIHTYTCICIYNACVVHKICVCAADVMLSIMPCTSTSTPTSIRLHPSLDRVIYMVSAYHRALRTWIVPYNIAESVAETGGRSVTGCQKISLSIESRGATDAITKHRPRLSNFTNKLNVSSFVADVQHIKGA